MNIINNNDGNSELIFKYTFRFEDNKVVNFDIQVDKSNFNVVHSTTEHKPEWAKMKHFKCLHCPLDEKKYEYCPLAINLSKAIGSFSNFFSYDKVETTIETEVRQFRKITSLQIGLGSLYGVLMVASDCPVMGKLKPMMRFHLPFATIEETDYRVLSMYLLAQFVIMKDGGEPDWEMNKLINIYEDIKILNQNVCSKISEAIEKDASVNAVVTLNSFAEHVTFILNKNVLEKMNILFKEYL
jgi:hypothetical protein